jgi:hypothetical protein
MHVRTNETLRRPDFKLAAVPGTLNDMSDEDHGELIGYLVSRLKTTHSNRSTRLNRYSRIDKLISTWQKLNADDTQRELTEDNTGRQAPIAMNLPILAAHLEDFVSFYSEVFAPHRRDFFVTPESPKGPDSPEKDDSRGIVELGKKMNRDTKSRGYYAEVCKTLRALAKYNVGGFAVRMEPGGGIGELASPGNRVESIDMYNYLWDTSITDISKVSTDAEWAARVSLKNQFWVQRKALKGELQRVTQLMTYMEQEKELRRNSKRSITFYRSPPTHVGLTIDGRDQQSSGTDNAQTVNWESYGAGLEDDSQEETDGFEITEMYCWLNPWQFGLVPETAGSANTGADGSVGTDSRGQGYQLWRFIIADSCQVLLAEPVMATVQDEEPQIPHYLAYMTQDDMKEAQRSVMELLKPFQRFGSFLMNIFVTGARKNIWGFKGVDPSMFDTSQFEHGEVAGWMKSKVPGRDVRTGLIGLDSNTGVQESMQMLDQVLGVSRSLFPSQAMPAQIASIDRAVKNQVSAVMQGVHRRLHMTARTLDANMFNPMRMQCYRNLAANDADGLEGLKEEAVATLLGSGLQSLNAEAAAAELREIIFSIIQNQEAMAVFDIAALFTFWSQLLNLPTDLGSFVKAQQPGALAGALGGAAGAGGLPGGPPTAGSQMPPEGMGI